MNQIPPLGLAVMLLRGAIFYPKKDNPVIWAIQQYRKSLNKAKKRNFLGVTQKEIIDGWERIAENSIKEWNNEF